MKYSEDKPSTLEKLDTLLADDQAWEESTGINIINNITTNGSKNNSKIVKTVAATVVIIIGGMLELARRFGLFQ